jgi:C-terminal processing protease CtpA/Prc
MKMWKVLLPITAVLLFSGTAVAQSEENEEAQRIEAEAKRDEMESNRAEYSERLREAEERMESAARKIAEITGERLSQWEFIERRQEMAKKPMIGITIEGDSDSGAVDGVEVIGITPESAADDAGLRAGDTITVVNGKSMSAGSSEKANKLLSEVMHDVEEGDELKIEYARKGNAGSVALTPRIMQSHVFDWAPDVGNIHIERIPGVPDVVREFRFEGGFPFGGSAWGRMELVELNEGLGKYFGTDKGLLVVTAPEAEGIDLQEGDVIHTIDDREPKDVRHAMKILGSYQSGEKLKLGIMRDKKKRTLEVEVPDDRRGSLLAPLPVKPASVPVHPEPHRARPAKPARVAPVHPAQDHATVST